MRADMETISTVPDFLNPELWAGDYDGVEWYIRLRSNGAMIRGFGFPPKSVVALLSVLYPDMMVV